MPSNQTFLSSCALALSIAVGSAHAATPAPIPVSVTSNQTPFMAFVTCDWSAGQIDNIVPVPVSGGSKLTILAVSYSYNFDASALPTGTPASLTLVAYLGQSFSLFEFPALLANGLKYVGTQSTTYIVADATQVSVRCMRTPAAQASANALNVAITGYTTP